MDSVYWYYADGELKGQYVRFDATTRFVNGWSTFVPAFQLDLQTTQGAMFADGSLPQADRITWLPRGHVSSISAVRTSFAALPPPGGPCDTESAALAESQEGRNRQKAVFD